MRRLVLCLAACAQPTTPDVPDVPDVPGVVAELASPPAARQLAPPPQPPRTARPSGVLRTLATIDDAELAITSDSHGQLRYWPSLDGKHEPVIVPVVRPSIATTVIRAGDGLAILSRDGLGQLEVIRIAIDGTWLSSTDVTLSRPVTVCAATKVGFIALRDDQVIEGIDPTGHVFGEIAPDPGTRVESFVQRNGRVLALFAVYKLRGQFIEIDDDSISWGMRTAPLSVDSGANLQLSPDGTRIAATRDGTPIVLELDTGKRTAISHLAGNVRNAVIIAWRDDATVWFTANTTTFDWSIERHVADALIVDLPLASVAGSAMVEIDKRSLTVYAKAKARTLGYRIGDLDDLVAASNGWVGANGAQIVRFDRELSFVRELHSESRGNMALLDARHYVNADADGNYKVFTFGDPVGVEPPLDGYAFEIDRASGLVANETAATVQFMHWDAKRGAFGEGVSVVPKLVGGANFEVVRLYDPELTDGVVAETVSLDSYSKIELTKFRSIVPGAAEPFRSTSRKIEESPNDNTWEQLNRAMLPSGVIARSADGTLIAELAGKRMSLRDRDGNVRWVRTPRGATGLAWNDDNELVAFGAGLAKIDQDSGDFVDPHCGWQFGLWTDTPDATGGAAMCTGGEQHADVAFEPEVIEDETP
jgi:hypothetical protein